MPYRSYRLPPTMAQLEVADRLRVTVVPGDTEAMLAARIADAVAPCVSPGAGWARPGSVDRPSNLQEELAAELGVDISRDTQRVAFARLAAAIEGIRWNRLAQLQLTEGQIVCMRDGTHHCHLPVSSIGPDGLVALRGDSPGYRRRPEYLQPSAACQEPAD
jgi:hypothetical protein